MTKFLTFFSFLLLLCSFLLLCKVFFASSYPDFTIYFTSAQQLLAGQNPYVLSSLHGTPYIYPPFASILFIPLLNFPILIAGKLWTAFSFMLLIASLVLLFRYFKQPVFSNTAFFLSMLVFLAFPTKFSLGMGQINLVILFLIIIFLCYEDKKKYIAGISLGVAFAIKLFPALLVLYLILQKKWNILTICLTTVLISSMLLFLFQAKISWYFLSHVTSMLSSPWKKDYYNQAFSGLLIRSNISLLLDTILLYGGMVLAVVTSIFTTRYTKNLSLIVGFLVLTNVLFNSFAWQHHFVWLILPFFAVFFYLKEKKMPYYYFVVLFTAYVLVALNLKNPQIVPVIARSHVFFGGLLLWIEMLWLFFSRPAKKLLAKV